MKRGDVVEREPRHDPGLWTMGGGEELTEPTGTKYFKQTNYLIFNKAVRWGAVTLLIYRPEN